MFSRNVACVVVVAPLLNLAALANGSQLRGESISSIESGRIRIVFPGTVQIGPQHIRRLFEAVDSQGPLVGVPSDALTKQRITISLPRNTNTHLDAWSFAREAVIVLPLERALNWDVAKLHRVVRHELTHLALRRYLGEREVPVWFREGFAEWVAGGLSCEQRLRLQMNLLLQRARRSKAPVLETPASSEASRHAYDLFASFFEFLEERFPGVVASGVLLSEVKEHGVSFGFRRAIGRSVDELERDWQAYLVKDYMEAELAPCDSSVRHP